MIWVVLYVATIFAANWAIAAFGVVPVGFGLMAPAGVYFAGLAFTFRDLTQEKLGRRAVVVSYSSGRRSPPWSPRSSPWRAGRLSCFLSWRTSAYTPL